MGLTRRTSRRLYLSCLLKIIQRQRMAVVFCTTPLSRPCFLKKSLRLFALTFTEFDREFSRSHYSRLLTSLDSAGWSATADDICRSPLYCLRHVQIYNPSHIDSFQNVRTHLSTRARLLWFVDQYLVNKASASSFIYSPPQSYRHF